MRTRRRSGDTASTAAPLLEDSSTPAVVLGCFRHGGVGVTRSLGRLGVPVYCVDADRTTPAFGSRYCRERIRWDVHNAPAGDTLRFLGDLADEIGRRSVLIAMSDIGAMLVADHADQLCDRFLFPNVSPDVVRSLCNKREMYHLARKCGVGTPETAFPESRGDVLDYLETARFPVLVKPIYSSLTGRTAGAIAILRSERELLEHYDASDARDNLMLQEFIPGPDDRTHTFNGYFDGNGECALAFTGNKLRNYPDFGQASLGVCRANDEVERTTIEFMEAVGYKGCLDLGYRYDVRDGRYKVNDVNPRVGAMFRLFVGANGMDVVRALYQDMTGQAVTPSATQDGRKWIVEDVDLVSSYRRHRRGELSLREWWESVRGVRELSYASFDDPGPAWRIARSHAEHAMRRRP